MADIPRPRLPPLQFHARNVSTNTVDSDSSDSSPDRERDDETDYFLTHLNDSESTICPIQPGKEDAMDLDLEQIHRVSPISKLPPELLIAIFSKLPNPKDLKNCMLVSYHWALYSVSILWHRPLCNKWSNLQNVARTITDSRPMFPYSEMVKRLNLSAIHDKVNDGTSKAFMSCKGIERLTLTNCNKLTDYGVAGLVDGNRRLQALDVTGLDALTDRTLMVVANNCAKLQGLNITGCVNITDESLVAVAQNCRQLKRLKLNDVFRLTDASVIAVAENCRSILEIDLAACQTITSESVTALLSNLPHLRELRLAQCTDITDSGFTNLNPKLNFDALRILDLTQCEQLRDDAIARIIPAAPRLRNLVLAKCRHITDRAVDSICKLTKNLHYIHLGHCTNLTDAAVINLVKHCNRIRYIDLACCSRLTDASVRHLAQLPKLRRIGLVKCQNLTDSSIMALAHGPPIFNLSGKIGVPAQFVSLERVHLSYCVNLTLKGITALLHHCPRLTHLSLTGVQAFLRDDLTRFCREAPSEFTHPQRDVFCVFSGDGVTRLRDYLTRLAMEEVEREQQNAIEENLLDPEDSPSADTMSDEGTIDGNEHGVDIVYGPMRHGRSSVSNLQARPRPRSLQNLNSSHVDMPLFHPNQMQQMGPWTPHGQPPVDSRSPFASANHDLTGSRSSPSVIDPNVAPRRLVHEQSLLDLDDLEEVTSRSSTRRHTIESGAGLFTLPSPELNADPLFQTYNSSPGYRSSAAFTADVPLPLSQVRSNERTSHRTERRAVAPLPQPHLRPASGYSAFDANHDSIMSTIPGGRGAPVPENPAGGRARGRVSNLIGNMRTLYSSPSSQIESASSSRETRSQEVSNSRDEAVLRAMVAADTAELRRPSLPPAPSHSTGSPLLPPEFRNIDPASTTTATSDPAHIISSATLPAKGNHTNQDVDMTQ